MMVYDEWLSRDPTYNFDDALDYAVEQFPIEFVAFWGIDSETVPEHLNVDDWEEYNRLYHLAERLAQGARELLKPRSLPKARLVEVEQIRKDAGSEEAWVKQVMDRMKETVPKEHWRQVVDALSPGTSDARTKDRFFWTCFQIHAAVFFFNWPGTLADRMRKLLAHLISVSGDTTRMYLTRVAECYIRDMRTEFAVMCRATLERALNDVVPETESKKPPGGGDRPVLADLIRDSRRLGILDKTTEAAARRIKDEGNRAVHDYLPGLEKEPDELLPDLVMVLERLEQIKRN